MHHKDTHIINKLVVEVNTNSKTTAFKLKDKLDVFLKQEIFPYLENYFKSIAPNLQATVIQIPKINLEIYSNTNNDFTELKDSLKANIKKQLHNIISTPKENNDNATFLTTTQSHLQIVLTFLEEGTLPWYSTTKSLSIFKKETLKSITKTTPFKTLFLEKLVKPHVQIRLINQFTDAQIHTLLREAFLNDTQISHKKPSTLTISKASKNDIINFILKTKTLKHIKPLNKQARQVVWQLIINFLIGHNKAKSTGEKTHKHIEIKPLNNKKENVKFNNSLDEILKALHIKIASKNEVEDIDTIESHTPQIKTDNSDNTSSPINEDSTSNEKDKDISKENHEKQKNNTSKNKTKAPKAKDYTNKKTDEEFQSKTHENVELKNTSIVDNPKNDIIDNVLNNNIESDAFLELKGKAFIAQNAGLILLHPYLNNFFETCNVLDKNGDIKDKELAVHLLHYLATKQEQQFESNMLFEKLLCGIPAEVSINRHIKIPKKLKQNAEELLEAVITNWGALNNASPDLLRNEFLNRLGKITFKNDKIKLVMERKIQDILLSKIPWTIGFCKLPWLKHLIITDW